MDVLERINSSTALEKILDARNAIWNQSYTKSTCYQLQNIWCQLDNATRFKTLWSMEHTIYRHAIITSNIATWNWMENFVILRCKCLILGLTVEASCWFNTLVPMVSHMLLRNSKACNIHSQPFTTLVVKPYHFKPQRRQKYYLPDETADVTVEIVTDILAQWLNFDMQGIRQRQAWFGHILAEKCGYGVFYLDWVWSAYLHLKQTLFGKRQFNNFALDTLDPFKQLLGSHPIGCTGSDEQTIINEHGNLLQAYADCRHWENEDGNLGNRNPQPELIFADEDGDISTSVQMFVWYLHRLYPLIDGSCTYNISTDQLVSHVARDLDGLLPFRERTPSHMRVLGAGGPFRESLIRSQAGIFGVVVFQGITYCGPIMTDSSFPVNYTSVQDFNNAIAGKCLDDIHHLRAYHTPNTFWHPKLVQTYWDSSEWWPLKLKEGRGSLDFDSCIEFLMEGSSKHFPQIGPLISFLTAGDLAYTSTIDMPTISTIAKHIRKINKGSANTLWLLKIVKSSASDDSPQDFSSKTERFYVLVMDRLSKVEIEVMGADRLMMEYALCKYSVALGAKIL